MAATTIVEVTPLVGVIEVSEMTLVRVDFDWVDPSDTADPIKPGTYVGALIIDDNAWYWHPQTGHPWVSYAGDYTIMEERG